MGVAHKQTVIVQRQLFIAHQRVAYVRFGTMRQHSTQLVHTLMSELWCIVLWYLHPRWCRLSTREVQSVMTLPL